MRKLLLTSALGSLFVFPSLGLDLADLYNPSLAQLCKNELESNPQEFLNKLKTTIYVYLTQDLEKNVDNLVNYYWEVYRIDETYDRVVKRIIEQYKENTSLWTKIKGNFSPDTAKKLGEKIAVKTFADPLLQNALSQLIQSVTADSITRFKDKLFRLQNVLLVNCLEDSLKGKMDPVLLKLFGNVIQEGTKRGVGNLKLQGGSVVFNWPTGGSIGTLLILFHKQIAESISKRLAYSMTTRIMGQVLKRVATRVIPVIGIILTAWDIKDIVSGDSLFNSLQEVLTSQETKDTFRREVVKALKAEITDSANHIAIDLSKRIYVAIKSYTDTLIKYNELLKEDPLLRNIIDWYAQRGETDKAQKLLELALTLKGLKLYDQLELFLTQPQKLDKLLEVYPDFIPVLKYTKSLEVVYRWYTLVGEDKKLFDKLVDYELYKYVNPQEVEPDLVQYLLSFSEFSTAKLLLKTLPPEEIKKLEVVPPDELERFIKLFGVKGVRCLTFYADIRPPLAQKFVKETLKEEKLFYFLCRKEVKEYLKENPEDFDKIAELYKESKNLFGKVLVLVNTLIGKYPPSLVKILSSGVYYTAVALWVLGFAIVAALVLKVVFLIKGVIPKRSKEEKVLKEEPKGQETEHYPKKEETQEKEQKESIPKKEPPKGEQKETLKGEQEKRKDQEGGKEG